MNQSELLSSALENVFKSQEAKSKLEALINSSRNVALQKEFKAYKVANKKISDIISKLFLDLLKSTIRPSIKPQESDFSIAFPFPFPGSKAKKPTAKKRPSNKQSTKTNLKNSKVGKPRKTSVSR
ncbi:MAG: hypothetical protein HOP11_03555 [Saprospiraceae bacterium]|nr:hypothetical protein [Saprospiraceae bacterium]